MENSFDLIKRARTLLLMIQPWYGHAAMDMIWYESTALDTMGVRIAKSGLVECLFNPIFVQKLTTPELCTVIQHEIEHVVRCHCIRSTGYDPELWNVAADMAVNGHKHKPKIGFRTHPKHPLALPFKDQLIWVPKEWRADLSCEKYYHLLDADSEKREEFPIPDDHGFWQDTDISRTEMTEIAMGFAQRAASHAGDSVPDHWRDLILIKNKSKTIWKDKIRHFVFRAVAGHRRSSYTRRNRRYDQFGLPGSTRQSKGKLSVVVDVSGSICDEQLDLFLSELSAINRSFEMNVLFWDNKYRDFIPNFRNEHLQNYRIYGGGGTNMAAPVDWLENQQNIGDAVIILTDGFCNWPEKRTYPICAAISNAMTTAPPWVVTVRI